MISPTLLSCIFSPQLCQQSLTLTDFLQQSICKDGATSIVIHDLPNGTVLTFSWAYRHPVAIVGETHSAGAVCSSQLNYLNIAKTKHASTLCCVQMHEQIYTWIFCEIFVVGNFKFLLAWIVCSRYRAVHTYTVFICWWIFTYSVAFFGTVPFASIVH